MVQGQSLQRDGFINQGSDKLVELVGTKPDYEFLKSGARSNNSRFNKSRVMQLIRANTYFGYILKRCNSKT
jgi:hypothetical protein